MTTNLIPCTWPKAPNRYDGTSLQVHLEPSDISEATPISRPFAGRLRRLLALVSIGPAPGGPAFLRGTIVHPATGAPWTRPCFSMGVDPRTIPAMNAAGDGTMRGTRTEKP
jgi:hypothetical protein